MSKEDREAMEKRIEDGVARERAEKRMKRRKKLKKEGNSFWSDFKKFISKGNIIDLAVAVVVGGAFNSIVTGVVNYISSPLIALLIGDVDLSEQMLVLREPLLNEAGEVVKQGIYLQWGSLLQAIINFLVIALFIFSVLRLLTKLQAAATKEKTKEEAKKKAEAEEKAKAEAEAEAKAKAKADAEAKAAEEARRAALEEREKAFYANVEKQTKLLEQIAASAAKN